MQVGVVGGGGGVGELGGGVVGVQVGVLLVGEGGVGVLGGGVVGVLGGGGGANIWKVRSCQKISCLH